MNDYRLRMKIEYKELSERTEKLFAMIDNAKKGALDFELNCPIELLESQLHAMLSYMSILELRAKEYDHVDLG